MIGFVCQPLDIPRKQHKSMIENSLLALIGVFVLLSIRDWRKGMIMLLIIGFIQDPLRKIVPDQPAYFVVFVGVIFFAIFVGLIIQNHRFRPTEIPGWRNGVAQAVVAWVIFLLLQLIHSYANFGSVLVIVMGVISYLSPLCAIFIGYYYASHSSLEGLKKFLFIYVLLCMLSTFGIYLEYFGIDSNMLGEVGVGIIIFDVGAALKAYSGFFRSSEIAAWHIFFGFSLLVIFASTSKNNFIRSLCILGALFLILAGVLTGRRKVIVNIIIFSMCYWILMLFMFKRAVKLAIIILVMGGSAIWLGLKSDLIADKGDGVFDLYIERTSSVFGDIQGRAGVLGFQYSLNAIKTYGLFGQGAGAYAPGTRAANIGIRNAGVTESGGGRIVAETGVIGLITLVWLALMFGINIWKILLYLAFKSEDLAHICYGLVGVLVASCAHFFVASQVFGDPFVLILLGLVLGFISSAPTIVYKLNRAYQENPDMKQIGAKI